MASFKQGAVTLNKFPKIELFQNRGLGFNELREKVRSSQTMNPERFHSQL
jgi:hypothetical protein